MRMLPNSLKVFGTIGAIGAAGALTAASAELKGARLASETAPAAARPSVKRLRVRISCMEATRSPLFWLILCSYCIHVDERSLSCGKINDISSLLAVRGRGRG